jgi:putative nucleotidyltransferase with HDIG domain
MPTTHVKPSEVDAQQLRKRIQSSDLAKSPPTILQELLSVVENPSSSAKDVQGIVEHDISCTVKLLKISNSAYYGFSRQVKSIREAIVIIGLEGVKNVAMSLAVSGPFSMGTPTQRQFLSNLWVHSMATATAASMLSKSVEHCPPSFAYCAGLIHDFGKVILYQVFGVEYEAVILRAREEKISLQSAEKDCLGVDHAMVGGWVAEAWDLPEAITQVVKDHHHLAFGNDLSNQKVALVMAADSASYHCQVGHGGSFRTRPLDDPAWASLGLDSTVFDPVLAEITKQGDRYLAFLHIDS